MAQVYARRVLRGDITLDQVPERLRAEVEGLVGSR
jgi:hypothetical protein